MRDKGLIQSVRPESADVRGQQTTLFPFDAFVFSSGRDGGTRYLDLKNGWSLVIRGDVRVGSDLKSEGFEAGVKGWILRGDGTAEFNDVVIRLTLQSDNYVEGVSGWLIDQSGAAEFYDVHIRGKINDKVVVEPDAVIVTDSDDVGSFRTVVNEHSVELQRFYNEKWNVEGRLGYSKESLFPEIFWAPLNGTLKDKSSYGQHGEMENVPYFQDLDEEIVLYVNKTQEGDVVSFPIPEDLLAPISTNKWTVSLWFTCNFNDPKMGDSIVVRQGGNFTVGIVNETLWVRVLALYSDVTGVKIPISSEQTPVFTHVAVSWDGQTTRVYKDNVKVLEDTSGTWNGAPGNLELGSATYRGFVKDLRIVPTTGDAVVNELYEQGFIPKVEAVSSSYKYPMYAGKATFVKETNEIIGDRIASKLGLEIGDVVEVKGAENTVNNKLFTVEFLSKGVSWKTPKFLGQSAPIFISSIVDVEGVPFVSSGGANSSIWYYNFATELYTVFTTVNGVNFRDITYHNGYVYAAAYGKGIYKVDVDTGSASLWVNDSRNWNCIEAGYYFKSDIPVLYAGVKTGKLYTIDYSTGTPVKLAGWPIAYWHDLKFQEEPIGHQGTLFASTTGTSTDFTDGYIYYGMGGTLTPYLTLDSTMRKYGRMFLIEDQLHTSIYGGGISRYNWEEGKFEDTGIIGPGKYFSAGYVGSSIYLAYASGDKIIIGSIPPGGLTVNYEHRNGAGPLSLADEEAENVTVRLLSKWYNASLGLGKDWVDVGGSRILGIGYTSPGFWIDVVFLGKGTRNNAVNNHVTLQHSGGTVYSQFNTGESAGKYIQYVAVSIKPNSGYTLNGKNIAIETVRELR